MKKNNINANGELTNPVGKVIYRKLPSQKFLYEISSVGEIRNVKSKKVLKWDTHSGYGRIQLGRYTKKVFIHQLVMEAWGPPKPGDEYEIDHIDSDPLNNNIQNLQWLTHKENMRKRRDFLTGQEKAVFLKDLLTGEIKEFRSLGKCGKYLNKSAGSIYKAIMDKTPYLDKYKIVWLEDKNLIISSKRSKPVRVENTETGDIDIYMSASKAAEAMSANPGTIQNCARLKISYAKKYNISYIELNL